MDSIYLQSSYFADILLEFAGIWGFYNTTHGTNWDADSDREYYTKFGKYSAAAQAVFANSYENRINDAGYRFERAVLFKGDYLPANNLHYNLLSTGTSKNNVKRDFTWKRLLRLDKDIDATERRNFVKAVFDDPIFDSNNPNQSLKAIFAGKTTGEQWRDCLIKYPSAIDYCEQGFISFFIDIEGCEGILPMYSSRLSGYHRELYTWGLYCELDNFPIDPFNSIDYAEQKVNDALPYLYFDGFIIDNCNHWMAIIAETNTDDWSLKRFRLEFTQEEYHTASDILNQLNKILEDEGFRQSDDTCIRIRYVENDNEMKPYLSHLFDRLKSLQSSCS